MPSWKEVVGTYILVYDVVYGMVYIIKQNTVQSRTSVIEEMQGCFMDSSINTVNCWIYKFM